MQNISISNIFKFYFIYFIMEFSSIQILCGKIFISFDLCIIPLFFIIICSKIIELYSKNHYQK